MAKATANMEVIRKIESLTLTLKEDEVNTLIAILRRVGGDPRHSPRKHADSIMDAVCTALNIDDAVYDDTAPKESALVCKNSSIYFDDYKDN